MAFRKYPVQIVMCVALYYHFKVQLKLKSWNLPEIWIFIDGYLSFSNYLHNIQ